jgi:hypothetical protein
VAWCSEAPCWQPLLNGSPQCYYHSKLAAGLLSDSFGKYHATRADRPELGPSEDGWHPAPSDLFEQLLEREPWSAWQPL